MPRRPRVLLEAAFEVIYTDFLVVREFSNLILPLAQRVYLVTYA